MTRALLLGAFLVSQFVFAAPVPVNFLDHGKAVKSLTIEELQKQVTTETVKVFEPHDESEIGFQALKLTEVLDKVYGPGWHKAQEVLFICADGYRDPISTADLANNAGWLAFTKQDGSPFAVSEKKPKLREILLAPLFLIRDAGRDLAARVPVKEGWPYQIVGIDLIEFADQFPGLTPPKNASASAKRGFQGFRAHCVTCHSLSGQGGKVGPELNSPVSVTTYYKEPWLKKWIANPSLLRTGSTMPAVIPPGDAQSKTIDDIIAYLKAMAPKK